MKITFIGAAHEVTGSCTLVEACGIKFLVDCGTEQGRDTFENHPLPVSPKELSAVILTHAHIDHSGMIPALVADGFCGRIISTEATKNLCSIMLLDSAHIQESEAEWKTRKAARLGEAPVLPVYTVEDARRTLELFEGYPYGARVKLEEGINLTFSDAGHLLGSASVLFEFTEKGETKSILFSGDIGNVARPLIRDPADPPRADYVVIESTYGDRVHGERPDYLGQLTRIIQTTLDRGGNVLIPSFAVGRTQELLYLIGEIKAKGLVTGHDGFPVYVDSPLAVEATAIYSCGMTDYYDTETLSYIEKGTNPIAFDGLCLSVSTAESRAINTDPTPKVIISTSGMCEGGRIRHHLKHNLWRSESTVLFVGYQSGNTLGRKLLDGAEKVKLFGEEITVRASLENLNGISGHADRDMLLGWLSHTGKPSRVFVNHGDEDVCESFGETVREKLGFEVSCPYSGDVFDLALNDYVHREVPVRVSKQRNNIFTALAAVGKRVAALIEKLTKEKSPLAAELERDLNTLCDKYEK